MPYFILAAVIVAADQAVKYLVRSNIDLGQVVSFLPGLLDLTFVKNTGAAFSSLAEHTWLLTLISALASLAMAVILVKAPLPHWSGRLALGLMLGGAVGNFVDRLLQGYVTDMFSTAFMNFPVFNVADIALVVGGILLCVHVIFFMREEPGKKEETAP
ncbi:MAG: signal peptidase II [Ruminiclostridium sp.]|nr:signal peptidase II [Ruminiclostridium sp.]